MSKICEKCGNVIPDGTDVCPNCGREDYNDEAMQGILNDLGISLDDQTGAQNDTTPPVDEPTIAIPDLPQSEEEPAEEDEPENAGAFDGSEVSRLIDSGKQGTTPRKRPANQNRPANPNRAANPNRPANPNRQERRGAPSSQQRRPSGSTSGQKKKKKKKNNSALIGAIIGLIIALALIAGGAAFMLYQMGFFNTMSDDQLLQTATTAQTAAVSPSPSMEAAVSAVESTEPASAAESSAEDAAAVAVEPSVSPSESVECTKFSITGAQTITLYSRGETSQVVYVIEPSDSASKIEWSSSDETIATVSSIGVISARRGGVCTITGKCGDKSIVATVNCQFTVPDTVLDMNMEDITMSYEGQTVQLAIDYTLTDEQTKATVWASSDTAVATVDDKGVVTAVADGTAVVTASIGDYTASCIVRCVDVTGNKGYNSADSEYVVNYEDVTLSKKGEYFQLTLKSVLNQDVPDFSWTSSDTSVATVDSKGVVTAVSDGTAYITTNIGADKFQCIVRVNIS